MDECCDADDFVVRAARPMRQGTFRYFHARIRFREPFDTAAVLIDIRHARHPRQCDEEA